MFQNKTNHDQKLCISVQIHQRCFDHAGEVI